MKTKYIALLSFSSITLILLSVCFSPSDTSLATSHIEAENNFELNEDNPLNETVLEIIEINTYPVHATVNQPLYVNITIKNSGQFTMAEIKNVKIEVDVEIGDKELVLRGTLTEPGEIEILEFNLTFLEIGLANVTFSISAENTQEVSESIIIEIKEDKNTNTLPFDYISLVSCLIVTYIIPIKRREEKR